jgi:hypothetical protein
MPPTPPTPLLAELAAIESPPVLLLAELVA